MVRFVLFSCTSHRVFSTLFAKCCDGSWDVIWSRWQKCWLTGGGWSPFVEWVHRRILYPGINKSYGLRKPGRDFGKNLGSTCDPLPSWDLSLESRKLPPFPENTGGRKLTAGIRIDSLMFIPSESKLNWGETEKQQWLCWGAAAEVYLWEGIGND